MFVVKCETRNFTSQQDGFILANKMISSLKPTLFAISIISLVLIVFADHQDETTRFANEHEIAQNSKLCWRKHTLPKLFDFNHFVENFARSYSSILEWMTRRKIYLGRVIRVFKSFINYKRWKSNSYLSINQFSDRTPEELSMVIMSKEYVDTPDNQGLMKDQPSKLRKRRDVEEDQSSQFNGVQEINYSSSDEKEGATILNGPPIGLKDKIINLLPEKLTSTVSGIFNFDAENEFIKIGEQSFCSTQMKSEAYVDEVYIDHRQSECLLPPGDQGNCMSCYAFATMAFYEWAHCKATGKLVDFSEQYIVDCGSAQHFLFGCNGGAFRRVGNFIDEFGLELEQNYPYIEQKYQCPFTNDGPRSEMGSIRISSPGWTDFPIDQMDTYLQNSPVLIGMKLNNEFLEYGGGVDSGTGCNEEVGLHAGLIIGSGQQDGEEYWLIRNSFSSNWGEQGNFKLNKKSDCLDPPQGYLLRAPFSQDDEENRNHNYNSFVIDRRRETYMEMMKLFAKRKSEGETKLERKFRR